MEIASPIKQAAAGKGGVYEFEMVTHRKLTVAEFRDIADKYKAEQLEKMQVRSCEDEAKATRTKPKLRGAKPLFNLIFL